MEPLPEAAPSGTGGAHGFPWRAVGSALVALLFLAGVGLIVASGVAAPAGEPLRPPQPQPSAALPWLPSPNATPPADDPSAATGSPTSGPSGMTRSTPTRVRIPRIGVDARVMNLGIGENGRIEVPPLEKADLAGWYELGPSPGEVGNSVVVGHVDSYAMGPAVFFKLGALKPGDDIEIKRKDGSVARFIVDGVDSYPKNEFPTGLVYGSSQQAGLRLVTCGGVFDESQREYTDNVIVFATLDPDSI
jgi:hypothetical protein